MLSTFLTLSFKSVKTRFLILKKSKMHSGTRMRCRSDGNIPLLRDRGSSADRGVVSRWLAPSDVQWSGPTVRRSRRLGRDGAGWCPLFWRRRLHRDRRQSAGQLLVRCDTRRPDQRDRRTNIAPRHVRNTADMLPTKNVVTAKRQSAQMSKITIYKWPLNPLWHRMLYNCTHMATVGVKWLIGFIFTRSQPCCIDSYSDLHKRRIANIT